MKRTLLAALTGLGLLAAAPLRAQTVQLCDQNPPTFPTVNIPNDSAKTYVVQSNFWNAAVAGGRQCLSVNQPSGSFTITTAPGSTPTSGGPASYPSIFKGCHWGNCTNNSGLPLQLTNIGTATAFWSINPKTSGQWDAALDIWFNRSATTMGQPDGAEIMVWLNHLGPPQPFGSQLATVTLNGISWTVWEGTLSGGGVSWNVVSYVRNPPASALGSASAPMDLKPFFNDAMSRGFVQGSWWLIAAEAGFEPWQDGLNLASTGFSATFAAGGNSGQTLTVTKAGSGGGTVTSSPAGINCGGTCSAQFANGTGVTLTAAAAGGSTFGGWSGACSGTGTCAVSMTQARSVTATFNGTASGQTLTVTKAGTGGGTVTSSPAGINCGATCSAQFANGTGVTLTAAAAGGSTFGGWSGACTGTGACTVSMTQARSVTATFTGTATGCLTATPVIVQNQPYFHEQAVRVDTTGTLTALTVQVVIQRTTGVSFSGMYNTVGSPIQQANGSTTSAITYTYTLAPGQSLGAGAGRSFVAQAGGTGTAHPTAGDTFTVTATCGGSAVSASGHF